MRKEKENPGYETIPEYEDESSHNIAKVTPVPSKSPTNAPVLSSIESVPYQHVQIPHDDISINGLTLLYQDIGNNGSPVDVFPLGTGAVSR